MSERIFRTGSMERWSFALFMAGQGIINQFVGGFYQVYLTGIGITAYAVGMLFLIARVWDAINDPIFGAIVDKTNFKGGKLLPWLRLGNILLPLAVLLLFAVPNDLSTGIKLIWACVIYIIY